MEAYAETIKMFIDELPFIKSYLFSQSYQKSLLFGGFLRWIVEETFSESAPTMDTFLKASTDVDIRVNDSKSLCNFLVEVVDAKGYIEYGGFDNYRASEVKQIHIDPIDITFLKNSEPLRTGNYLVYVPYESKWIKYDISYNPSSDRSYPIDFTVNQLVYPSPKDANYESAFVDIKRKRIQFMKPSSDPKTLFRMRKLWKRGYRFDNYSFVNRLYKRSFGEKKGNVTQISFGDNTLEPSIMDGNHHLIRTTDHEVIVITSKLLAADPIIQEIMSIASLEDMTLSQDTWKLPEYDTFGVTEKDIIVYKACKVKGLMKVIVVSLQIPNQTKFNARYQGDFLKLRFEEAKVLDFYAYPDVKLPKDHQVEVVSHYQNEFKYVRGETVTPTEKFGTSMNACAPGIHGFHDIDTAWIWFGGECDRYIYKEEK